MCGLGFNGLDAKGKANWDGIANVNILKVEVLILLQTVSCSLAWKHVKRLFLYSRHTVCLLEGYSWVLTVPREKQKHKGQVF